MLSDIWSSAGGNSIEISASSERAYSHLGRVRASRVYLLICCALLLWWNVSATGIASASDSDAPVAKSNLSIGLGYTPFGVGSTCKPQKPDRFHGMSFLVSYEYALSKWVSVGADAHLMLAQFLPDECKFALFADPPGANLSLLPRVNFSLYQVPSGFRWSLGFGAGLVLAFGPREEPLSMGFALRLDTTFHWSITDSLGLDLRVATGMHVARDVSGGEIPGPAFIPFPEIILLLAYQF